MDEDLRRTAGRRRRRMRMAEAGAVVVAAGVGAWWCARPVPLPETVWARDRVVESTTRGAALFRTLAREVAGAPGAPGLVGWQPVQPDWFRDLELTRAPGRIDALLLRLGLPPRKPRVYRTIPADGLLPPAGRGDGSLPNRVPSLRWRPFAVERDEIPASAFPVPDVVGTWDCAGIRSVTGSLRLDADGTARLDTAPGETRRWGFARGIVYLERFGPLTASDAPVTVAAVERADTLRFAGGGLGRRLR